MGGGGRLEDEDAAVHPRPPYPLPPTPQVVRYTARLQETCADSDGVRNVVDYCHRMGIAGHALIGSGARAEDAALDATAAAEKLLEGISLMEAVTVSPVFVCVIAAYEGVPALLRALAVVAATRMVAASSGGAGRRRGSAAGMTPSTARAILGGASSSVQAAKSVSLPLADEVLSRTCNTLAHLARVAYEVSGGQVEADPEYEPVNPASFGIGEQARATRGEAGGEGGGRRVTPPPLLPRSLCRCWTRTR